MLSFHGYAAERVQRDSAPRQQTQCTTMRSVSLCLEIVRLLMESLPAMQIKTQEVEEKGSLCCVSNRKRQ